MKEKGGRQKKEVRGGEGQNFFLLPKKTFRL